MSDASVNHSEPIANQPEQLDEVLSAVTAGEVCFGARLRLRCDRDANMLYASGKTNGLASPVSSFPVAHPPSARWESLLKRDGGPVWGLVEGPVGGPVGGPAGCREELLPLCLSRTLVFFFQ